MQVFGEWFYSAFQTLLLAGFRSRVLWKSVLFFSFYRYPRAFATLIDKNEFLTECLLKTLIFSILQHAKKKRQRKRATQEVLSEVGKYEKSTVLRKLEKMVLNECLNS
ncbi:hypothetical protein Y032_0003g1586 [Ancylostoma ceylanicum]|uniref:Uncharacterized protein n=1 Tax=Ancylostoma ceylanicum TaxID=53326 RepID=A0A016VXY8_9BILA|nr:hypothetical protein Y032_0003g1586 [Ancylostoma ceylanicum]